MNSPSSVKMAGNEERPFVEETQPLPFAAFAKAEPHASLSTRILLLTDSFPPHAGGSREYYYNIYKELVALGNSEVTVLTKKVPGWEEFDCAVDSAKFRIIRRFKPLANLKLTELPKGIFPFLQTLWRIVRKKPEIIHVGDLYPQGLTALFAKRTLGIPYLIYCHGEEVTQMDRYRYQPRVRDLIYRSADAIVANSQFACGLLSRIGVAKNRIHKINPGVDGERFKLGTNGADLRRRFKLEGKSVILTVARLVPRKGHRAALQAFFRVYQEFPNTHYLIVGTGPEEDRLKKFVRELGLEDHVSFAGFVPSARLPEFYTLCDLMLLANREEADGDVEGFGIVFLEANAAGKPVIGGRTGGAVEAIQDGVTGLLVDPDDQTELVEALRRLLSNAELRERLGRAGLQRTKSEFNWRSKASALDAINYEILCTGNQATDSSSGAELSENPEHAAVSTRFESYRAGTPDGNLR